MFENISIGDLLNLFITIMVLQVAFTAWLIRLESIAKQSQKDIVANAILHNEAIQEGDNRMNKIEERTNRILDSIFSEIKQVSQSVNDKFTSTSNAVSKLEGIMLGRDSNRE